MKKFIHKFKDSKKRLTGQKQEIDFNQDINDLGGDSTKHVVVDPNPTPAPGLASDAIHAEAGQDDVAMFSGFGSWLSSFTADPHGQNIAELPANPAHTEVLTMKGFPPQDYIHLTLNGVKKPGHTQEFIVTIQGPWYMTLQQVCKLLKEDKYEEPVSVKHASLAVAYWNADKAVPKEFQIFAVDGPSCYAMDAESGLLINRDEPIGQFADTLRQLRVRCKEGKVMATSFPAELEITFNRTLRLPEDGKVHNQPSGVGHIPVMNMACISRKLQNSGNASLMDMARRGGVFFPLYQREAMFLSFEVTNDSFAVRPFVGGVNAISGLPWNAPPSQRLSKQDYVSVPPQESLDGIAVGQGTVKQLIAMPLGSGYSVEKQVTGREDIGGMQLEITPGNQWYVRPQVAEHTSPYDTPRSLNIDFVILDRKSPDAGEYSDFIETCRSMADWIEKHRPIYMRQLYVSQLVHRRQARYGYRKSNVVPGVTPWQPGANVYMTAIYPLNLTLSYEQDGAHRIMAVKWQPWWTPSDCHRERRRAEVLNRGYCDDERYLRLLYQGKSLKPCSLEEQGVKDNSIIHVVWGDERPGHWTLPDAGCPQTLDVTGWGMGIAAGSRIRQTIKKDPFSSDTWYKARAAILSIQILNSVAFESLTGKLAPPSPITPQMYKQHGLPFFESYGEGVVTDGAHNLAGVKSVGQLNATGGNIQLGSSLTSSTKVGCTCCGKMLCDSILRPCNHTFCLSCVTNYMTYDNSVCCRICGMRASNLLGFSAPMALPGEDRADFSDTKVVTIEPYKGALGFYSIYELDATPQTQASVLTSTLDEQHQGTYLEQTVYELSGRGL